MKQQQVKIFYFLSLILSIQLNAAIIETFGDSLTHGMYAKTSVENSNPTLVSTVMSDLSQFGLTHDLEYVEKYGNKNDAWPRYLRDTLQQESSIPYQIENKAMMGEQAMHLEAQVKQINFSSNNDVMAFFFMGHNDLCGTMDATIQSLTADFKKEYRKALIAWDKLHVGAKAYLLPLGSIDEMFNLLNQYVWFESSNGQKYRCNDNWGLYFPYCRKFGTLTKQGKIKQILHPRIEALDKAISDLADEMNHRSRENHFFYLKNATNVDFVPSYFALDCFHLSTSGQMRFAKQIRLNLVQ